MEHRTLRPRTDYNFQLPSSREYSSSPPHKAHSQFERILQSIEDYSATSAATILNGEEELPPPARILPYSGIKPHHNDGLVRPIAFRPVTGGRAAPRDHRQSFGPAEMTSSLYKSSSSNSSNSNAGNSVAGSRYGSQKPSLARDQSKSIGNLVAVAAPIAPIRPVDNTDRRACGQDLRYVPSNGAGANSIAAGVARQNERSSFLSDNEYDSVADQHVMEYRQSPLAKRNPPIPPKKNATLPSYGTTLESKGSQNSSYSSLNAYHQEQHNASGDNGSGVSRTNGHWAASGQRAPLPSKPSRNVEHSPPHAFPLRPNDPCPAAPASAKNYQQYSRHSHATAGKSANGTQYRRASSGAASAAVQAHITPSPSDSGIVDYETLIRDKENELSSVRLAMEQNEGVLVRVHREKEHQLQSQIESLRQRLHSSQQNEELLRRQLRQSEDIRRQLQNSIQMLTAGGRNRQSAGELLHTQHPSPARGNSLTSTATGESTPSAPYSTMTLSSEASQPVPAPRRRAAPNNDELRGEVDDLKSEISTLRDQLQYQIRLFTQDRLRRGSEQSPDAGRDRSTGCFLRPMIVGTAGQTATNNADNASGATAMDSSVVMVGGDRLI